MSHEAFFHAYRPAPPRPPVHRADKFETGRRNLALLNRAGAWLTLMMDDPHTEMEWSYRPNAFRRKDYGAASFSTRDVFTDFFRASWLPDLRTGFIRRITYDPFVTRIATVSDTGMAREFTFLNLANGDQAFAIGCDTMATLAFSPRGRFEVQDGLIYDRRTERGEDIVSYILFRGLSDNRVRFLDDGTLVLQIIHGDHVIVGAESTLAEVWDVRRRLAGRRLPELIATNEEVIAPALEQGRAVGGDETLRRCAEINHRILLAGMDANGMTSSAHARIYHLWWVRDSALIAAATALAGDPTLNAIFAPANLDQPARVPTPEGGEIEEFTMLVGARWNKQEDDGLYYTVYAAYTHWQMTGDESVFTRPRLDRLVRAADRYFATRRDPVTGVLFSPVLCETTLRGGPFFGGDPVNGEDLRDDTTGRYRDEPIHFTGALHLQLWGYNVLRMLEAILREHPRHPDPARADAYGRLAAALAEVVRTRFLLPDGTYISQLARLGDGRIVSIREDEEADHSAARLNNTWSHSSGPFHADLPAAIRSAQALDARWPRDRAYSSWNHVVRLLQEFGGGTAAARGVFAKEVADAFLETEAYPMTGGILEFESTPGPDGEPRWRGDPWANRPNGFACSTFLHAVNASLLQTLPCALGVRAADVIDGIDCFVYRASRIFVRAEGSGDAVAGWTLDGQAFPGTLQIPEDAYRAGRQELRIDRSAAFSGCRLRGSTARLLTVRETTRGIELDFICPTPPEFWLENARHDLHWETAAAAQPVVPGVALPGEARLTLFRSAATGPVRLVIPR